MKRISPTGFTLIEVVVAILLLSLGALALAGSAVVMARRMGESARATTAVSVGRTRAELSFATPCEALAAGSERARGAFSEWSIAAGTVSADITQRITHPATRGDHFDDFLTAAPCK